MHNVFTFVLFAQGFIQIVFGHGMLLDPVSRGSRWRFDARAPINYDDNQLFCGGFSVRYDFFFFFVIVSMKRFKSKK